MTAAASTPKTCMCVGSRRRINHCYEAAATPAAAPARVWSGPHHAQRVEGCAHYHPRLAQHHCPQGQAPPPQLLSKVAAAVAETGRQGQSCGVRQSQHIHLHHSAACHLWRDSALTNMQKHVRTVGCWATIGKECWVHACGSLGVPGVVPDATVQQQHRCLLVVPPLVIGIHKLVQLVVSIEGDDDT
jgi:hypothetical protein